MVFCDISKAFDRVWHKGLTHKVYQYGINGNLLNWLNNYLCNRTQTVFEGSDFSSPKPLKAGVPQGSVLGPLLDSLQTTALQQYLLRTLLISKQHLTKI